jgi:hypothetical protein
MPTAIVPALENQALAGATGPFQPRPDELPVGPVPFNQTVQGIALSTPVSALLSVQPQGNQLQINARILADLSDLQRKIGPLVDTIPLPKDSCDHNGIDNLVATISNKDLTISGSVATLTLQGQVEDWVCEPFLKTILLTQPFNVALLFEVVVSDPQTIAVQLGQPSVTLDGQFSGITGAILNIAGVDINAQVKAALDHLINPDLLKQTLPAALLPLHPSITRAELLSNSGPLALYVEMNASIDGTTIGQLIRKIFVG